jgi:hypothetical protein
MNMYLCDITSFSHLPTHLSTGAGSGRCHNGTTWTQRAPTSHLRVRLYTLVRIRV